MSAFRLLRRRRQLHLLLEGRGAPNRLTGIVDALLITLIVTSSGAVILGTLPEILPPLARILSVIEICAVGIFTLEYALRLYAATADRDRRHHHPLYGRLRYALKPMLILDLLAILPEFLLLAGGEDWLLLRLLRLFRLFKLTRYSPAMATLLVVFQREKRTWAASLLLILLCVVFAASLAWMLEREVQPDHFGSIPAAMYWATITIATVGYGDIVPVTPGGKLIAAILALAGAAAAALPTAVLAAGFVRELRKHDFLFRYRALLGVPHFSHLPQEVLADLVEEMRPVTVPAGRIIQHRDQAEDHFYILASGEARARPPHGRARRLKPGDFWGEGAIEGGERPAHLQVEAVGDCELLSLRAREIAALLRPNAPASGVAPTPAADPVASA